MAVNETIVTGRKFRKLIDAANKQWQRISFWHKASDCEFDDGKTAETKVGAIDGITSDLSGESETVAASIKCVNQLNSSLVSNIYVGSDGKLHKVQGGADSVLPFNSGVDFSKEKATLVLAMSQNNFGGGSYTCDEDCYIILSKASCTYTGLGGSLVVTSGNVKTYYPLISYGRHGAMYISGNQTLDGTFYTGFACAKCKQGDIVTLDGLAMGHDGMTAFFKFKN